MAAEAPPTYDKVVEEDGTGKDEVKTRKAEPEMASTPLLKILTAAEVKRKAVDAVIKRYAEMFNGVEERRIAAADNGEFSIDIHLDQALVDKPQVLEVIHCELFNRYEGSLWIRYPPATHYQSAQKGFWRTPAEIQELQIRW